MKNSFANSVLILTTIAIVAFGLGVSYTDSWIAGLVVSIVATTIAAKSGKLFSAHSVQSAEHSAPGQMSQTSFQPTPYPSNSFAPSAPGNDIGLTANPAFSNYPNYVGHPVTHSDVGFQNVSGWENR